MTYLQISEIVRDNFLSGLKDYKIKNLDDLQNLHKELIQIRNNLHFDYGFDVHPHYRGEQLFGRDIIPGIFRPPFSANVNIENARLIEKNAIKIFKEKVSEEYGSDAIFKYEEESENSESWNLLFQAQHAGVKTNLIDLSTSIFSSAFFASEPSEKHDDKAGQIWCLLIPSEFIYGESTEYDKPCYSVLSPFQLDTSFVCNVPTFIDNIDQRKYQFRLFRQHGRLFVSSNRDVNVPFNKKEFWENMMIPIKILPEDKKEIFNQLNEAGINHEKLILDDDDKSKKFIAKINEEIKNI